ncbi:DoxX family protein [Candidatus Pacearchaeota archaeon]|nr:MAG: DoxX family protein [Candidatus Pacearchaeota archaeon]
MGFQELAVFLLAVMFGFAGSVKLFGEPRNVFRSLDRGFFRRYGLTRTQVRWIGVFELLGVALLALSFFQKFLIILGALVLLVISLGALGFHLKHDTIREAAPSIVAVVLSLSLTVSNWYMLSLIL